jgi:prepilin-type N-terminal cleavage/methylation domain-containing protein/prepilin-type processing-associated H-X9-DG protein
MWLTKNCGSGRDRRPKNSPACGFTFLELLVVIAIIALLAAVRLPALTRAKATNQGAQCLNNLRQLQSGWCMYAADNREVIPGNRWQDEANHVANDGNWVTGWLSPEGAPDPTRNPDNTNTAFLVDARWSQIGPYLKSAAVYKCVADQSLAIINGQKMPRVRSVSMSSWMGPNTPAWNPGFRVFGKTTDIVGPSPSDALVFLDERSDSIDDGYFAIEEVQQQLPNLPAAYHNGASGITFADGHAEIHKWRDGRTVPPLQKTFQKFVNCSGSVDWYYLAQHGTSSN